jgi:hypothetical protein
MTLISDAVSLMLILWFFSYPGYADRLLPNLLQPEIKQNMHQQQHSSAFFSFFPENVIWIRKFCISSYGTVIHISPPFTFSAYQNWITDCSSPLVHSSHGAATLPISRHCRYSKDNENQHSANDGMFILYIFTTFSYHQHHFSDN